MRHSISFLGLRAFVPCVARESKRQEVGAESEQNVACIDALHVHGCIGTTTGYEAVHADPKP